MNLKGITKAAFVGLCFAAWMTSCIKDEAANAEADIVACAVSGNLLIREPVITNTEVKFYVNGWEDLTSLAPTFTLTEGATIEPASGTKRDFTSPQTYTVTSQDGQWKKTYKVSFISGSPATEYHFENIKYYEYADMWNPTAEPQKKFHIFYDRTIEGTDMEWSSGNAGFMITNSAAPATDYPTSQAEDGYKGKCAKLVTRSTGSLGAMMKAPLAAGNLFIGEFKINIMDMAKSTRFGMPFRMTPLGLDGYFKYKAGEKYINKNSEEQTNRKDVFDIYAVMYEVTKDVPYLDGTNIKTHENVVMMAQVENRKEAGEWTRFSAEFKSVKGRTIDAKKLRNGSYNLAIVLSSSEGGADFNGAVGSTLYVDEINLYYK